MFSSKSTLRLVISVVNKYVNRNKMNARAKLENKKTASTPVWVNWAQ